MGNSDYRTVILSLLVSLLITSVSWGVKEWSDNYVSVSCPNPNFLDLLQSKDTCSQTSLAHAQCKDGTDSASKLGISTSRLMDFVFLVEHPGQIDGTKLEQLRTGVFNFLQNSISERERKHSNIRFAMIVYLLGQPLYATFVHGLSPLSDEVDVEKFMASLNEIKSFQSDETVYDVKLRKYLSVESSLRIIASVIDGEEIMLVNGSTTRIYHRPQADLHIVTAMNLYAINKSKQALSSKDMREGLRAIDETILFLVDSVPPNANLALYFFIDQDNEVATSAIGDPSLAVSYTDCTHFNKALTLKALIAAGKDRASSLQAHLLAKGVEVQVRGLAEMNRTDCVLALNSALWSGFGLHATFLDVCSLKTTHSACPSNFYCSPLHGCIRKKANSTSSHIFEGKAPLSADFSLSHAELARSGNKLPTEPDPRLPVERLSITTLPSENTPLLDISSLVVGKPRVLKWSPDEPFAGPLIRRGEPVLLKNSVVRKWPAIEKWNFSHIAENIGYDILEAVKCTNSFLTFDPDRRAPLKVNISIPFSTANMSTETFFHCIQHTENCPDGYKGHYYFTAVPDALRPELIPDRMLYNTDRDYEAKRQFMWISSAGMITHGHFDQDFNFFVQLVGEKRFTLWAPSQHELLYVYPRIHPLWHKSRINFRAPDISKFPQFAKSRALQVVLGPGDVLFVPPYTWHYVETLSPSVSLSTWSHDYILYDHMNSIYRHDHKFDLLEDPRGEC